jgi:hypothetical protein
MSETERLPNTVNLAFVEGLYLDLSQGANFRSYRLARLLRAAFEL